MPQIKLPPGTAGAGAIALTLAAALTTVFEGNVRHEYRDVGGVPTICYGDTHNVRPGEVDTHAQCDARLRQQLAVAAEGIRPCIIVPVGDRTRAAMVDFAYNVGARAFCNGSVARDLNSGRHTQACADLNKYVYANGQKLRGLVRRRQAEQRLCMEDAR